MNDIKKIFKVVEEKTPIAKTNDNILIPNYSGVKNIAQKNYTWTFTDNVYLAYQKGLYSTYSTGANVQVFEVDNGDSNTAVSGVANVNKFGMNLNGVQIGNSTGGFSCSNVSTHKAAIRVNSTEVMSFDNAGKIGIGVTAPTAKLSLTTDGTGDGTFLTNGILIRQSNASTAGEVAVSYQDATVTGTNYWIQGLNQSSKFALAYGSSFSDANTKMTVLTTGEVGIGTVSPTHSLTLNSTGTGIALYNTADQTTNYERVLMNWTSNVFEITSQPGGTGNQRTLRLKSYTTAGAGSIFELGAGSATQGQVRANRVSSGTNYVLFGVDGTSTASSGVVTYQTINPTINQSSTAGYTALLINPTETATGSGIKNLINAQVGGTDKFTVSNTGVTTLSNVLQLKGYTVATLPTGTVGDMAYVTDAVAPTYLGALTGGGTVKVPVFYNGTAWVSH